MKIPRPMPDMPTATLFFRIFAERGPRIALATAGLLLFAVIQPASAQFFNFGGPPQRGGGGFGGGFGGGWFGGGGGGGGGGNGGGGDIFAPYRQAPRRAPVREREDFSRAPSAEKRDTPAERNVLVLGDAMADWLGYGLEDAFSDASDMGVIRKNKSVSGLIRYQPKGEPSDWIAAAKTILATEKPDAIVVMLGLHDRMPIRETAADKKLDKKDVRKDDKAKSDDRPDGGADDTAKADDKPAISDLSGDDADAGETPSITAPEKSARSPNGVAEFRDERWVELYTKKIEDMIRVVKSKGVPVLWVGLPAVRGTKATADMLFLDSLYRDAAGKAGITYVDVWDGFVDDGGHYLQTGPDFEGQIRRLRAYDGVFFTKAGARKLAHYVEREITRVMASRSAPIEIPTEPAGPEANVKPGGPAPRPLVGPVLPLVAASVATDQLLGGPGSRLTAVDPLAARTLVKGEPLTPPAGRADDFAWPRRDVGRQRALSDPAVASIAPGGSAAAAAAPVQEAPKPKRHRVIRATTQAPSSAPPATRDFFGLQQSEPSPATPRRVIRPPADVGAASVPGFFTR